MKLLRYLLITFALFALACSAQAASRFGVCSVTCTWDGSSTAMWSASSGGATGASVPGSGDTVTFDANTCVGGVTCTITVNTTVTVQSLTWGACTASTTGCIIDFSVNNNNVTLTNSFSGTGTGTRKFLMGSGTWTWSPGTTGGVWNLTTTTNLDAGSVFTAPVNVTLTTTAANFNGGAKSWGAWSISGGSTAAYFYIEPGNNANNTFASLSLSGVNLLIRSATTQTIIGAFSWSGTSSQPFLITGDNSSSSAATISAGAASTCNWCVFRNFTTSTSAVTATNSYGLGTAGGGTLTITNPSGGGGGGFIIGG